MISIHKINEAKLATALAANLHLSVETFLSRVQRV